MQLSLLPLLGLLSGATAHGLVQSPPTRSPSDATAAVCGQTMVNFYKADNTSYPEALFRANPSGLHDGYDPEKCNLWLCKGYQFEDNAAGVQQYSPGQEVTYKVWIRVPHEGVCFFFFSLSTLFPVCGEVRWYREEENMSEALTIEQYANVSVVDTTTNSVIGSPLIAWPSGYAASATPPLNQTDFSVTIPDNLGGKCSQAGVWYVVPSFVPLFLIWPCLTECCDPAIAPSSGIGLGRVKLMSLARILSCLR